MKTCEIDVDMLADIERTLKMAMPDSVVAIVLSDVLPTNPE